MKAADELAKHVGVKPACAALEVSRSTLYRRRGPSTGQQQPRPTPARALSETERGEVFDTLCSERFVDRSPAEVVATLLDEEVYLCSERTMYRVLASEVPVQERRAQRTHPEYKKPELMATAPNQVWSWDITRLLGPKKWSYYYLYVIMDIYSRYVVGWMVADRENSALAGRLIQQSCLKHGVQPRVLTLHSDRGAPMTSPCTAQLLADLGVTRSLSRPQVSDDNPFSEAQFKTLKYHPSFPGRFGDQGQAKTFCRSFFRWYNAEHRHGGISMLTPEQVHFGNADQVIAGRKSVLREAWAAHPERFVRGVPKPQPLPEAVFINPPIPSPHHTGHCSLINPVECPIVVDRFRIKRAAKQLGVDLGAVLGKSGGEYEESLKALELGDLSVYPPAEQLKRARDHFVDVVAEVETGGARRAKVDEAKDTLLEKSRAYNASGPGYVKDFELIQESLKRLAMPSSFDSEEPSRQESEEEDPEK